MTHDRGLRPVLDTLERDGCPRCGELPAIIGVNGPREIVLEPCGHVIDGIVYKRKIPR